jgi:hypothetical protein
MGSGSDKYEGINKARALGFAPQSRGSKRKPKRQTASQLAADIAEVGF